MIEPHILAQWPVLRLMQEIETRGAGWDTAQVIAAYRAWLACGAHADAYAGHYNLGTLYHNDGQTGAAEEQYRAALRLVELPQARYSLGLLMEGGGRLYEAMAEWRALLPGPASALQLQALDGLIRLARRTGQTPELLRYLEHSLALAPQQPALAAELAALRAGPQDRPATDNAVIYVMAVCFNEAAILPFFLDHYIHFLGASKVVLHDGGSSDGSAEIAARYPQVEWRVKLSDKLDDRELMAIRNEEWKKYRNECDWMVVCDVDELLYHPQLRARLAEFKQAGVTLPMVEGFEMLSKEHPRHVPGRYIWQSIQTGTPNPQYYNKNLIFDPVIDINYLLGCHSCAPTGPVRRSDGPVFQNLHYRMLSHEHIVQKSRRAAARLSDWNKQTNAGFHYRLNAEMPRADYNRMFASAFNVISRRQRPAGQRALFDAVQQHLTALDADARIVELGAARGFGHGSDSGSTEFLAWYVHDFGGALSTVEPEAQLRRHVAYSLQARLLGRNVMLAAPADALPARIDLLVCNAADYLGDAGDRSACQHAALAGFTVAEASLTPEALVLLDGIEDAEYAGKFQLLARHLLASGYAARGQGYTQIFSKFPLKTN